jgi:hypothetical protein
MTAISTGNDFQGKKISKPSWEKHELLKQLAKTVGRDVTPGEKKIRTRCKD